jgi:hypothetical protein
MVIEVLLRVVKPEARERAKPYLSPRRLLELRDA